MSFEYLALVREAVLPSAQKVLLYALGSRANADGRSWPSVDRLCRDTGVSRRAVQTHLGILITLCAVERTTHAGRASEYRLNVAVLRALADKKPPADEPVGSGQLADKGCMPCAPPAHVMRTPAHSMRPTSASDAPEVKEEVKLNNQKQAPQEAGPVHNAGASPNLPWWRSRSAVMLMGASLEVFAAPGEPYAQYKDRVYRTWRERLSRARSSGANSANQN